MDSVWKVATGTGITVAVIDTGVAATGTPYFDATRVTTYDYLNGPSEDDWEAGGADCAHGSHVASLIAAGRPGGKSVDPRTNFAGIWCSARALAEDHGPVPAPTGARLQLECRARWRLRPHEGPSSDHRQSTCRTQGSRGQPCRSAM